MKTCTRRFWRLVCPDEAVHYSLITQHLWTFEFTVRHVQTNFTVKHNTYDLYHMHFLLNQSLTTHSLQGKRNNIISATLCRIGKLTKISIYHYICATFRNLRIQVLDDWLQLKFPIFFSQRMNKNKNNLTYNDLHW